MQPLDLHPGFGVMILECPPQPHRRGAARHDGQLCDDLLLRVHQVVELGRVQVAKRNGRHPVLPVGSGDDPTHISTADA